ncbi:MAG: hypothetical protein ACOWWH_12470 [Eubacteriaceae bacterium]
MPLLLFIAIHNIAIMQEKEIWKPIKGYEYHYEVCNLEWNTVRENNIHAYENGLKVIPFNHGASKPVLQIDKKTNKIIKEYPSAREAYRQTNIHFATICDVCRGRKSNYSAGGYIWRYKN